MKKYLIWVDDTMGYFEWADNVVETNDTVSFYLNGKLQHKYKKKEIKEYVEVRFQDENANYRG